MVSAVASAKGVAPEDLDAPLYEAVDPDALDAIFAVTPTGGRVRGRVVFTYCGYEVTVSGDGDVALGAPGR